MSFESKVIDTTVEKLFGTTSCLVIKPLYEKGLFRIKLQKGRRYLPVLSRGWNVPRQGHHKSGTKTKGL